MHDSQEDRRIMESYQIWPYWPFLPVKKPNPNGNWPKCATLMADDGKQFRLFNVGFWDRGAWGRIKSGDVRTVTIDQLIEEGWVVD